MFPPAAVGHDIERAGGSASESVYHLTQRLFSIHSSSLVMDMNLRILSNPEEFESITERRQIDVHHQVSLRGPNVSDRAALFRDTCQLFVKNPRLLERPYEGVHSRASEAHFRLFVAAVEGATTIPHH
jgi:hypothetical protein